MRIEHLEYLKKIVESGSIIAAAAELYISPQGLSQAIKQLEKELTVDLFNRTGNKLELTRAGRLAYESGKQILAISNELSINLNLLRAAENPAKAEHLNIFATHGTNATYLPNVLTEFHKICPSIRVRMVEMDSKRVLEGLESRAKAINLFGLPEPVFEDATAGLLDSIRFHLIAKVPLNVCISRHSPLASREFIALEDLLRAPLVLYHTERRMFADLFNENEADYNIILNSNNHNLCRTMIANDENAIGFTNILTEKYTPHGSVITKPFLPEVNMVYGYFLTNIREDNENIRVLIDLIHTELSRVLSK